MPPAAATGAGEGSDSVVGQQSLTDDVLLDLAGALTDQEEGASRMSRSIS